MNTVTHAPTRRNSALLRRSLAVLLGCVLALAASAQEIWRIDNLKRLADHDVTVVGSPRVLTSDGRKALSFDGVHDGLFIPAIPISGAGAFTIELLFRPAEGGNEAQRFFHVQDAIGRRALLELRANGKGGWWLDAFLKTNPAPTDRGLVLIDPKRVHSTDHWHWVAMRYDGKTLTSFVDGVKELVGTPTEFAPIGDGKVSIGVRQNLVYWFKGEISEVRFHREAIAEDKLQKP